MIRGLIRSALAILAGIATLTALSFAIEAVVDLFLMRLFPASFPNAAAISRSQPASLFMFGYGFLSTAAGGFVTAWLARRAPVRHAFIMGAVQTLLTVWAMSALKEEAPLTSWVVSIIMALPAATSGGWLYARRMRRNHGARPVSV